MSEDKKYIVPNQASGEADEGCLGWENIGQMKESQFKGLDYVVGLRKYCIEQCGGDLVKAREMESYLIGGK